VPPVASSAVATGIIAPSSTMTGQSIAAYGSSRPRTPISVSTTAAVANATCTGSSPATTAAIASAKIRRREDQALGLRDGHVALDQRQQAELADASATARSAPGAAGRRRGRAGCRRGAA
jgi:hypothetical protein